MDHLVEYGVQGFRSAITLFPDWAAYVIAQCRENGYDQQQAIKVIKENYAMILANPDGFGVPSHLIKRESTLAEVRHFDLKTLPMVDTSFLNEMANTLLSLCVEKGHMQHLTIQDAHAQLLDAFPNDFHAEIKSCIKSVYAALCYHPGAKQFFVSPIAEVDAYNPFVPHHFSDDDIAILYWVQNLLCRLESMEQYIALDNSFQNYSERFRAWIDYLLDGSIDSEACFELIVSSSDGVDNYSLSVQLNEGAFELHLQAWGVDSSEESFTESILYWYVDSECYSNEDATKNVHLQEYEHWFVNITPDTKITSSFSIGDWDPYEVSNRPKQLDFIRLAGKENS